MTGVQFAGKGPGVIVRSAGTVQSGVSIDVRTVAGPATYTTGGIPIDLSGTYTTILNVTPSRGYVTSTLAAVYTFGFVPNETGTDLYANAKFRLAMLRPASQTFTGSSVSTSTPAASATCVATCNQNHPNLSALTVTAAGTNASNNNGEVANGNSGTNNNTYEFMVMAK